MGGGLPCAFQDSRTKCRGCLCGSHDVGVALHPRSQGVCAGSEVFCVQDVLVGGCVDKYVIHSLHRVQGWMCVELPNSADFHQLCSSISLMLMSTTVHVRLVLLRCSGIIPLEAFPPLWHEHTKVVLEVSQSPDFSSPFCDAVPLVEDTC